MSRPHHPPVHVFDTTAADLGVPPGLSLAAVYRRIIDASVDRIWENVFDWEHLPVLHDTYFNAVELLSLDADGWRVRLSRQPGDPSRIQVLHLQVERAATRYSVTTLEGTGTGTRICTQLRTLAPQMTAIEVRYYLPEHRPDKLEVLSGKYRASCQQLWDEDEAMMRERERMTGTGRASTAPVLPDGPLDIGSLAQVRDSLPMTVRFGEQRYRVVEVAGQLVAHSAVCPHWLGPLDQPVSEEGCVRCPWHAYQFDVVTGESVDGRGLRLAPAPRVVIDHGTHRVRLEATDALRAAAASR